MLKSIFTILTTLIFIITGLIPYVPCRAEEFPTLAILDLEASEGVTEKESLLITDLLRDSVMNSRAYTVMAQDQMRRIIETQGFNQSGFCSTTDCEVKLGELLQVQKIMAGRVGKLGDVYIMVVRLIDVEKGSVIMSRTEKTKVAGDLTDAVDRLAKYFAGKPVTMPTSSPAKTTGNIEITTNPASAEIFINNQSMGLTPDTIKDLEAGTYSLTLKKAEYKDVIKTIKIEAGKTITENINLDKMILAGLLEIRSEPEGARVIINNEDKGNTPVIMENLKIGTYKVKLIKEGYKETEKEVIVKFNDTTTERFTLEKIEDGGAGWVWWVILGSVVVGGVAAGLLLTGKDGRVPIFPEPDRSLGIGW